ncbi:CRISPR-associated helicase Cas3' [Pseudorhodobacter sp. W20_MBD10_FR17]|uniref:CRISPR-associated helicase Cas3' n=1 Tax=Pseudorhodobacter sp. W20_MBD10_FR17 TaxID=3240266 RepID=UPI003F9BD0E3
MTIFEWPGKSAESEGGVEHPAVYHMLDVAAVAELLTARFVLPVPLRDAFVLLAALHDLGKVSDSFRRMLREGVAQPFRHWELTEVYLLANDQALSAQLGGTPRVREVLYAASAGHHGRPPTMAGSAFRRAMMAAGSGQGDASTALRQVLALWPEARLDGVTLQRAIELSWWLPGLVTAADWIGSNTKWFAPCNREMPLTSYLSHARENALLAVREAGLADIAPCNTQMFDFALRPMQSACAEIALQDGPVLAVIEDETGAGKTEAALILAQRMLMAGKGGGLFFALPTMATADAMFARAVDVVGRMFDASPCVTLAHGRAGLSQSFRDLLPVAAYSPDDVTCTDWLRDGRRRALLADVGIGTIDQALLAVLPTKFQTLRHFGLSSKILIVDEVHELGEPYIGAELEQLLRMHRAAGGSAILLTATLPLAQRARLLAIYGGAANSRAYPALTLAAGSARNDLPQETGAKGAVAVERLGSMDAAVDLLVDAASRGAACVWVRNAVDDAIAAVAALRARGVAADLLHARFALSDRKRIEADARARFGKDGTGRAGRVLVGTQVLESSLDLDFDVMVSDLAPMAALIQRAGRLWRHMDLRPAAGRPVAAPVLYVISPDPTEVRDDKWLHGVLDRGAYVYPVADQWRTADHLFAVGQIVAPGGLRDLIEAVHGVQARDVPDALTGAEQQAQGKGQAERTHAAHNIIRLEEGFRAAGRGDDDADYPTRLGQMQRVLVLARLQAGQLVPWAEGEAWEAWTLSEVSAALSRLDALPLSDQTTSEIAAITADWPEWKRSQMRLCPVGEEGRICEGLRYDATLGLVWD